jgi:multiple sugar transport system substrate-binding protein
MTAFDRRTALGLGAAALAAPRLALGQAPVEITVHYAQPQIFKESYDAITAEFAKREPNIRVNFITTPNYEEGNQLVLRQAATNQLPDLSYQGFNRLRVFAERGIAQDLTPFLQREGDPAAQGYSPGILALAHFGGFQSGLAYAASNPISYYSVELFRRVGQDPDPAAFPKSWDEVIALSSRIRALGDGVEGLWFQWPGDDWMFSALLFSHGARMLTPDERDVGFAGPEGLSSLRILRRMVTEGGMPNLNGTTALQAFAAGKLGMRFGSTAFLRNMIVSVGRNFEMRTALLPVVDAANGRLPTGGAAGMLTARDPAKREAAWKYLRFSTSAEGTTLMVKNTGYVPTNQLAIDDPRWLGEFYADNPLFRTATLQVPRMIPWYAFPGANSVRVTQVMVDNMARVVEGQATPEQVLPEMAAEVRRLLPRRS